MKISNRKPTVVLIAAILVIGIAGLSGCIEGEDDEDTVVVGMTEEVTDLNPIIQADTYSVYAIQQMYDPLVRDAPDGEINTEGNTVADDIQFDEDELTYTIELQEGIYFHHGEELTAEDVVFTFEAFMDTEEYPVSPRAENFDPIADVEQTGEYELEIILEELYMPLESDTLILVFPVPKDYIEENGWDEYEGNWYGTGPYEFVEHTPAEHVKFEANDDYWREGLPNIENLRLRVFGEETTLQMSLQQGEIHFAERMDPDLFRDLDDVDEVETTSNPEVSTNAIWMNHKEEPWDDVNVRKALAYAIDMDDVIAGAGDPDLHTSTRAVVPTDHPAHPDGFEDLYEQDIERAKELLDEAGYDEIESTVYVNVGPRVDELEIIQDQVTEANIHLELNELEWGTYLEDVRAGEAPLWSSGWTGRASANSQLELYNSWHGFNDYGGFYNNTEFEEVLAEANREPDFDDRMELYHEAQEILIKEDCAFFNRFMEDLPQPHHESIDIPEQHWNPYMDAGPIAYIAEWEWA